MTTIINVVDAPCGYGKTSWAIQYMNEMPKDSHQFIYITPFLDEVERVKESVTNRKFYEPTACNGETKLDDLHRLLGEGKDICTTHALFQMANAETRELLSVNRYTLILDEVMNVIEQINLKKDDLKFLLSAEAITIEEKQNGLKYITWNEEKEHYDTQYNKIKNIALTGNLMYCDNSALIWNFPCEVFSYFQNVFVLTYLFKGQIQKSYFDLYKVVYRYLSIIKVNEEYEVVPYKDRKKHNKEQLKKLINIYDGHLNEIGRKPYSLSSTWLNDTRNNDLIKVLKNNARNYLMNICKGKAEEVMWTTVKGDEIKNSKKGKIANKISPKGYINSFIPMTSRATNEFKNKHILAYLVNRFLNPIQKKFFEQYDVKIDQNTWALSELIQWVWRSRIRDGNEIKIYLPSKRMKDLFVAYLNSDKFEEAPTEAIVDEPPSDWYL